MKKYSNELLRMLFVAIAAGVLLSIPSAYAQVVTGSMIGTITDSSGAVVPGAKVTITDQATSVPRVFTTDQAGVYSVTALPPSTYKVAAEKEGFSVGIHADVQLFAAQTARIDITLQPGAVTQEVTVAGGAAPQMQTDTSEVGRAIDAVEVADLPLSQGHNYQGLMNLVPGAEPGVRTHSLFNNAQNALSAPVNGMPARTNFYNIEGLNNNQRSGELAVYTPAMEAIQEVQVTTSNYDPAQGAALGSVVNVIIKSGSNQFHGEGYEFWGGDALNARSFFALGSNGNPYHTAHSVDNYFGGNVGGPIKKDKTFFFVDYYDHRSIINYLYTLDVPTPDLIAGNFSATGATIYDPLTGDMADCIPGAQTPANCGTGRTAFTNNIIPANRIDPVAKNLMSHLLPCTNCYTASGGFNYNGTNLPLNLPLRQLTPDLDVKIDEYISAKDHFSTRYAYQNPNTISAGPWGDYGGPLPGSGTPGAEGHGTDRTQSFGINWVHVFSPTFLTEVRVGMNRYNNLATQAGYGKNLSTQVGVPGLNFSPKSSGLFAVNGEGFSDPLFGPFGSLPWAHPQTNITLVDNTTWVKGNHTMEFGMDYFRLRDDYIYQSTQFGGFNFGAGPTELNPGTGSGPKGNQFNQFADFLLGIPTSATLGIIYHEPTYRQNQIFPYFGDKWQVTKKLTANLGLRWEYYGPPTSHFAGDFSNYNPTNNNIYINGFGGIPNNEGVQRDLSEWAPRIGLAYRLTSKDVLRAGYGMSSMAYPLDIYISLNFPVTTAYNWNPLGGTNSWGPDLVNPAGTTWASSTGTFEAGFPALPPGTVPSNGIIPVTGNSLLSNATMYYVPVNWKHPYVMAWNFAYERELPGRWVFDVTYVGNRTVRAAMYNNINASTGYNCGNSCQPEYPTFGRTAATNIWFAYARNSYDALQFKLDHHFAHNFSVTTSYTWGNAIGPSSDNTDYANGYLDYVNLQRNKARTDFDSTQLYSQSLVYFLPFGADRKFLSHGVGAAILGGWELSGSINAHTGFPFNFGGSQGWVNNGTTATPNQVAPFKKLYNISSKGDTSVKWFDPSSFVNPANNTQGTMGYYLYSGPGFFVMNASLSRTFKLSERFKLLLRSEWLNATNTPQFANPNATVNSSSTPIANSNFGTISGVNAYSTRTIDLVGKLIF